jgi:hypothetical protein
MKTLVRILPGLLCAASVFGADVTSLVTATRGVAGEFAADALIRIAALDQIDKTRKVELLEQAFQRASEAQQGYKRRAALVRLNGPIVFFNKVNEQELDGLSLRLRVVEAMLPLDPHKARDLFLKIPAPRFPKSTCNDFMVYDPGRFFDVLGSIAHQAYSEQEAAKGDTFRLYQRYAGAISSPIQVGPMARAIASANVADADFVALLSTFSAALAKISGDDRAFSYSRSVGPDVATLVAECNRRKATPLPLIESYRLYLVVHLTASRCADNELMETGGLRAFTMKGQDVDQRALDFVGYFNEHLRMPPLQAIEEGESTPSRLEGAASGLRWCQDDECQSLAGHYRNLILGPNGVAYPTAERNTPEWAKKVETILEELDAWKSSRREGPAEQFREKALVYNDLLNVVPAGAVRDHLLHSMIQFLLKNPVQATNRTEWFLPVNALIGRAALDPAAYGKYAEDLRKVDDPVVALYAQLEAVAPRTPAKLVPLL